MTDSPERERIPEPTEFTAIQPVYSGRPLRLPTLRMKRQPEPTKEVLAGLVSALLAKANNVDQMEDIRPIIVEATPMSND